MAQPVEGDSNTPEIPGVKGTNSANTANATGVRGEGLTGIVGFGIQVGLQGIGPPVPGFVAVKGDGGGIPGIGGIGIPTYGVVGTTASASGFGVQGINQSGGTAGDFEGHVLVHGILDQEFGDATGVHGKINSKLTPGSAPGGFADPNIKAGVWGENVGGGYGVRGTSTSIGIFGNGLTGVAAFGQDSGVFALGTGPNGIGLEASGVQAGVKGEAGGPGVGRVGVWGRSGGLPPGFETGIVQAGGRGVLGCGVNVGVQGNATTGHGVDGDSQSGIGVAGGTGGTGPNAVGVFGIARAGAGSFAGVFQGNVDVRGNLSKSGGGFKIDHPLEPTERYLNHSFVESSERKNVYDGIAVLDENGQAVVKLPAWFGVLNRDFRYQLTCIGAFAPLYIAERLSNNQFVIAGGRLGMEVSWQVTGIRSDGWACANPLYVEEEKHALERGRWRHSEPPDENDTALAPVCSGAEVA